MSNTFDVSGLKKLDKTGLRRKGETAAPAPATAAAPKLDATGLKRLDTTGLKRRGDSAVTRPIVATSDGDSTMQPQGVLGRINSAIESVGEFEREIGGSAMRGRAAAGVSRNFVGREVGIIGDESARKGIAENIVAGKQYPQPLSVTQMQKDMNAADGWLETAGVIASNPRGLANVVTESAAQIPELAGAAVAGGVAGAGAGSVVPGVGTVVGAVVGRTLGTALASFGQEYGSALTSALDERGIEATEANIQKAFDDPEFMSAVREKGLKRGIPIAVLDGASAGIAGKILAPVAKATGALGATGSRVAGATAEVGTQAVLGSAGEAGAQLVDKGKIDDKGGVLMEGIAEIAMSGHEIALGAREGRGPDLGDGPIPEGAARAEDVIGAEPGQLDTTGLKRRGETVPDTQPAPVVSAAPVPEAPVAAPAAAPAPAASDPTIDRMLLGRLSQGHASTHIEGMRPELKTGIASLIEAAPPNIKAGLGIGSGFRPASRQAEIVAETMGKYGMGGQRAAWEADVAAMGPEAAGAKWRPQFKAAGLTATVGMPGGSNHQHGEAADLNYNGVRLDKAPPEVVQWIHQNAGRFGLAFPLGNEAWHVETAGARSGGAPAPGGAYPETAPNIMDGAQDATSITSRSLGVNDQAFGNFRAAVAQIEGARYNQMGGSSNRFAGKYQMGGAEIAETAAALGEPVPTTEQFLNDPAMQDRFFDAYTESHHRQLMNVPEYANASAADRLKILGYAHNQGVGGATKWLQTGTEGRDAFGTSGKRYFDAVGAALGSNGVPGIRTVGEILPDAPNPDAPINSPVTIEALFNDERSAKKIREDARERQASALETPAAEPAPIAPTAEPVAGAPVPATMQQQAEQAAAAAMAGTPSAPLPGLATATPPAGTGLRTSPIRIEAPGSVNVGAELTAIPTAAQAEAGNYRKRHVKFDGLDIAIETEQGQDRTGVDKGGKPWSVRMPAAYGYVKRTVGADGDQVDVYLGGEPTGTAFVVDQITPENGRFDEHKVMLGFPNEEAAMSAYQQAFSDGRGSDRAGAVTAMTQAQLKEWLRVGSRKPVVYKAARLQGQLRRAGGQPADLVQFLARSGGIQDFRGELNALGSSNAFVPGAGRLVRQGGMTLDRAREIAAEAGYLGAGDTVGTTSVRDLLDALDRNNRGQRVFSTNDMDAVAENDRKAANAEDERVRGELDDLVKETGANLRDGEIGEMLDLVAQGETVEDAFVLVIERNAQAFLDEFEADQQQETPADERIPFEDASGTQRPDAEAAPTGEQREGIERGGQEGGEAARLESGSGEQGAPAQEVVAAEPATEAPINPSTEADGQTVLPGAEEISQREQAERKAAERNRASSPQKGMDIGMFGTAVDQTDLLDLTRKASTAVADARETQQGALPVADDRERQRLENVRKLEAQEAEPQSKADQEPEAPAPQPVEAPAPPVRAPSIQKSIPDTPQARRAVNLLGGAKPGDQVTPSDVIGYSTAGATVTVTSISKKGNVYVTNADGASTDWSMADLMGAQQRGVTFGGQPVAETAETVAETAPEVAETADPVAEAPASSDFGTIDEPNVQALARAFSRRLIASEKFATILQARTAAGEMLGGKVQPGTEAAKRVDEAVELGVVLAARETISTDTDAAGTYDALVDLYDRQPSLNVRTSTSVANQAYSTPMPLAFVASRLAGITESSSVYEPTAGNGALLIAANPQNVRANELDPARAASLREQGFATVTTLDATAGPQTSERFDVVIENPPFGVLKEDGRNKLFDIGKGRTTTEIDHAIVLKSLQAMKADGSAVLIIGGVNKLSQGEARSEAYNGKRKREFFYSLYGDFNVVDHFTVAGELYAKQGAAWPVDVIVIKGTGKSARALPAVDVPRILSSWDEVKGLLDVQYESAARPVDGPDVGSSARATDVAADGRDGEPAAPVQQLERAPAGERTAERDTGGVRGRPDRGQSDDVVSGGPDRARGSDASARLDDAGATGRTAALTPTEIRAAFRSKEWRAAFGNSNSLDSDFYAHPESPVAQEMVRGFLDAQSGKPPVDPGPNTTGTTNSIEPYLQGYAGAKKGKGRIITGSERQDVYQQLVGETTPPPAAAQADPIATTEAAAETAPALEKGETAKTKRADPEKADTAGRQVAYKPKSKQNGMGTLVPVNMQTTAQDALGALVKRVGELDAFVAKELGIPLADLGNYFAAEQVDGIALGIDNFSKGAGMVIGDQTGIGKGRQVAGILRWAMRKGKTPIFVTEKPNLYADMYRDLVDVGVPEMLGRDIKVIMTNSGETVPLNEDGSKALKSQGPGPHGALLKRLTSAGKLDGFDMVFTTYSQMQTVKGAESDRMRFIRAMAEANGVIVFDEAHNAGGQTQRPSAEDAGGPPNRAQFARELLPLADAVLYSSATYAKRPEVMDLYAKTDMRLAVDDISDLAELIQKGGVPMQQVVASQLSQAGQYVRRERSFDGVVYDTPTVPVDRKTYEAFSRSIKAIQDFSEEHVGNAKEGIDKEIKAEAKSISADNATGGAGATSTNFTSIMHNVIDQMLLAITADHAAELAIESIKAGEKPVITLANTLESFLDEYASDAGLRVGDPIDLNFNGLLDRYLERSRVLIIKKPYSGKGESERHYLTDRELGAEGVAAFKAAKEAIRKAPLGKLPVSPVDWIKSRIEQAGYSIGEITGRTMTVQYGADGSMRIGSRPGSEKSIAGRRRAISGFNGGTIDAMLLNQAGSTGLSLHASEKVADKRKRHMIIAQAEGNIDTHMQMLGRVHRTGQVITPRYSQLVANIPAQKRPASVLAKKMASLNASTTASRDSAMTAKDVPDFMNEYGDKVAAAIMADNPDIHQELGEPLHTQRKGGLNPEDAMRRVTGRIPLLPLDQQEALYDMLEGEYAAYIAQLEASGENALEAKTLDLNARTIEAKEVKAAKDGSDSPFAAAVSFERVDVKQLGKPMSSTQVVQNLAKAIDKDVPEGTPERALRTLASIGRERMRQMASKAREDFAVYRRESIDSIAKDDTREAAQKRAGTQLMQWNAVSNLVHPGATVRISNDDMGSIFGVVTDVQWSGKTLNPLALGAWKMTIATADASRQLTLGFSQVWTRASNMSEDDIGTRLELRQAESIGSMPVINAFDDMQMERREDRIMVTGNILAGYDFVHGRGQIINFTDDGGRLRQGILMRRDFEPEAFINSRPVRFERADQIRAFLDRVPKAWLKSTDGFALVKLNERGDIRIATDAGRGKGGTYYLNKGVLEAAGRDFVKVGSDMRLDVPPTTALRVLDAMKRAGAVFETSENIDIAKEVTGGDVRFSAPRTKPLNTSAKEFKIRTTPAPDTVQVRALTESLRAALDRIGLTDVGLQMAQTMEILADGKPSPVNGMYLRKLIGVALTGDQAAPEVLHHEALHAMRRMGLFTEQEWTVLSNKSQREWMERHDVDGFYGGFPIENRIEEGVAYEYGEWASGQRQAGGVVARLFKRIRDFIEAIGNAMRGLGFTTAEGVFRSIQSGEVGNRQRNDGTRPGSTAPAVMPDLAAPTDAAFKRWFGNSRVVDAKGKPAVAYHGSRKDIIQFAPGKGQLGGQGMYFTTDPKYAGDYALGAPGSQDGANITPAYLSVQNPLVIRGAGFVEKARARLTGKRVDTRATESSYISEDRLAELQAQGYDGIINEGSNEIVVFSPTQIKSPFNQGTFDPNDERIAFSVPGEPETNAELQQAMQGMIARGQPIDRAMTVPFSLFGGLDENRQWKPGVRLTTAAERVIVDARFAEDGKFAFLNPTLTRARVGLIDRYGLDPAYVTRDRARAQDERRVLAKGAEILQGLAKANLSLEESRVLQAMLTDKTVQNEDMAKLAEPIRLAIDQLSQEAVSLGLISAESYERNRGAYLNRSYMKYESEADGLSRFVGSILGSQRKKIVGNSLKGRGIFLDVSNERLTKDDPEFATAMRGNPEKGERFIVLDEISQQTDALDDDKPPRVIQRVYWPADRDVPVRYAGFRNSGEWEVRAVGDGKVTLWRDYTKAERTKMGEILDARYLIGKTYMQMSHDLASGRFLKDIAENGEWSRSGGDIPNEGWREASEYNRYWADETVQWVRVPDTAITGTGGKKKWGALAGRFVRAEIWRDINETETAQSPNFWRRLLTQWKLNKTVRNPVVHMNNVMSNLMFMDLADVRMQDLVSGIASYAKGDAAYREAAEAGAFGNDMISQEIRRDVLQPILDELQRDMQGGSANALLGRAQLLGKLADRIWSGVKGADQFAKNAYRIEDEVFRMAAYNRRRSAGDNVEDAARFAAEQFLDYDIKAPWIRVARNSVLPFISYTYRAAPVVAKAIAHRPWKLAKYFALAYGINAMAYAWSGDDEDDEKQERASLRREEQGYSWMGVPRMARMPWRDSNGLPVFLDTRRWTPVGDIFDTGQGQSALPIPAPLLFGGPIMLAGELAFNRSAFTGDDLVNKLTDTGGEKAAKIADWAWKSWAPAAFFVPGSWYWEKIENAWNGAVDKQGRPISMGQALGSSVGIKLKAQDVENGFSWHFGDMKRVDDELKRQFRRAIDQHNRKLMSDSAFEDFKANVIEKAARNAAQAKALGMIQKGQAEGDIAAEDDASE